jgi:NADPH-dependent 2,4-dienoyl-CoA reductase/sulfur reductase-like enzyme
MTYQSVYSQTFDVVIIGAGYAGFAAALEARSQNKTVLLVDRQPAVLNESSWAFSPAVGKSTSAQWKAWINVLADRNAGSDVAIDGAIAEVFGNKTLTEKGVQVLYYATPVGVHVDDAGVAAVALAMKEGIRVVRGQTFIDATDTGELVSLVVPSFEAATPTTRTINLGMRFPRHLVNGQAIDIALPGAKAKLVPSFWPNEAFLSVDLPGDTKRPRSWWAKALAAARSAGTIDGAIVSHGSVIPVDTYAKQTSAPRVPANLGLAVASVAGPTTLAERFELGLAALGSLKSPTKGTARSLPHDFPESAVKPKQQTADVVVAGAGTGGAFAAISAAREGVKVTAVEPLPFVGGIGAGGGIHWYYFGVRGGLQEEADQRTREIMPVFGSNKQLMGFHPDVKKCVIETMMDEAGVNLLEGSTLYHVDTTGQKLTKAYVATPKGAVAITSNNWIDSTGDGDLAAHAGAKYFLGRSSDGQLHAFTQSSGRVWLEKDEPKMRVINYDAGFVDPTDTEDLSRARQLGMTHYVQAKYDEIERPTYIAPALGLRQGRHIETDYVLQLHDLISRATFPDAVGLTGAHYDNHAIDYEFETDEAMFWTWVCRQWRTHMACQIPYRMILPVGFDNLWIACRAAGVSIEAHHSMRMQRDIQRLGEIAGYAASICVKDGTVARTVSYPKLRAMLEKTGALKSDVNAEDTFGPREGDATFQEKPGDFDKWVADLKSVTNASLYHLMKHEKQARPVVVPLLNDADKDTSWRAATIVAMWNDSAAEPRLLKAIKDREVGFQPDDKHFHPDLWNRMVPWWITSIALLRRCGTAAMLPVFQELAADKDLVHTARTSLALTLTALGMRAKLTPEQKDLVAKILLQLLSTEAPNTKGNPQRRPMANDASGPASAAFKPTATQPVVEDFSWQLHLAVAQAEHAAHLPIHKDAAKFLKDPRATVRKAFTKVMQDF